MFRSVAIFLKGFLESSWSSLRIFLSTSLTFKTATLLDNSLTDELEDA